MNDDMLGSELIDLQGLSLSELRDEIDSATVKTALDKILSDPGQTGNHGFNQYI